MYLIVSHHCLYPFLFFFFFNDTATTEIYTLSLHDALPISPQPPYTHCTHNSLYLYMQRVYAMYTWRFARSEEHTSELQSLAYLVCRLLLEKKKKIINFFLILEKKKKKK